MPKPIIPAQNRQPVADPQRTQRRRTMREASNPGAIILIAAGVALFFLTDAALGGAIAGAVLILAGFFIRS